MNTCPDTAALIEQEIGRVLTQYRESPKLLHMIRTYLRQVAEVIDSVCVIPDFFDINTAVGDQLTLLGKRLGFPRCHCICNIQPVFGFDCLDTNPSEYVIAGFCDDNINWVDCGPFGSSDICILDDELYRAFLLVRRYQILALYDLESLTDAIRILWGASAMVLDAGNNQVVIAPGRELTRTESALLQVYPRVLPIAPGIRVRFHFGPVNVFGFGEGWGGFCEEWEPNGTPIVTHDGDALVDENGNEILTGPLTRDSVWICAVDPKPYDC